MDSDKVKIAKAPLWGSCRLTLVVLCFIGAGLLMILRFNLSMAIVCMTENTNQLISIYNETLVQGEFAWKKSTQGYILSSFFYGYISTQIIGGVISDRWGGKPSLTFGMFILSLGSLILPPLARLDISYVIAIRIVQGLVSGMAFPSLYNLFVVWSSPDERATLMSIVLSGIATANFINLPLASGLCATGIDGGWPMVFYVPGSIGVVWCIAFQFLSYSSPKKHPRITSEEKNYLMSTCQEIGRDRTKLKVPLKQMSLCVPVHALWIVHMCHAWGYYLVAVNLPLFGRDVLRLGVVTNGLLSCLPYAGMFLMTFTAGIFDHVRRKELVSLTVLRKIFNTAGMVIPAICMIGLNWITADNIIGCIVLLTVGMSGHHFSTTGGYYLSHSDIAGPFSGTLFGITNTMAQIPGFANALIVAHLTPNGTREEWLRVFDIAALIFIIGCVFYNICGSSELQDWAKNLPKADNCNDGEKEALASEPEA